MLAIFGCGIKLEISLFGLVENLQGSECLPLTFCTSSLDPRVNDFLNGFSLRPLCKEILVSVLDVFTDPTLILLQIASSLLNLRVLNV